MVRGCNTPGGWRPPPVHRGLPWGSSENGFPWGSGSGTASRARLGYRLWAGSTDAPRLQGTRPDSWPVSRLIEEIDPGSLLARKCLWGLRPVAECPWPGPLYKMGPTQPSVHERRMWSTGQHNSLIRQFVLRTISAEPGSSQHSALAQLVSICCGQFLLDTRSRSGDTRASFRTHDLG